MLAWLDLGDPDREVAAADLAKELLRETYLAADAFAPRRRFSAFYEHCDSSGVSELERLARTIGRWETPILRWHRTALTNAATEGTNLLVKNIKRLGFGLRNFQNYRPGSCSAAVHHANIKPLQQYDPTYSRVSA